MTTASTARARSNHLIAGGALVLFVACYSTVIQSLVHEWSTSPVYSYGFLVPIIAAYICWLMGPDPAARVGVPDYAFGIVVTLAGTLLLLIGRIGSIVSLEYTSLLITFAGLVLLVFGRRTFNRYRFALAYLFLMIPIWNALIERLQEPSRLLSARIAATVLDAVGVPVLQQGTNLALPVHTLAVMRECSGVNQLVAMVAMVIPATYLWMSGQTRRIALVVIAVVITYLSNGLRIALVGWLAFTGAGDGNLLGSYAHVSEGLFVAMIGYVAIAGCFSLLSRWGPQPVDAAHAQTPSTPQLATGPVSGGRRVWLDVAVATIMIVAAGSQIFARPIDVTLRHDLSSLPSSIGEWAASFGQASGDRMTGVSQELVDAYPTALRELRFSGVDDELARTYSDSAGHRVQLYIGYYKSQTQGKKLTGEAADALRLMSSSVAMAGDPPMTVGEVTREIKGAGRGILYWYDVQGWTGANLYEAKAHVIWDGLVRRRTAGAVIMIAWQGQAGSEAVTARQRALDFGRALAPVLRQTLSE